MGCAQPFLMANRVNLFYMVSAKFCFYVRSKEKCCAGRVEAGASRDTIGSSSAAAAAGCPASR